LAANERREGEGGEKSSDDNGNDDDDDKTDKTEKMDKIKLILIPEQFQSGTNLEICNWLVAHPHILQLANQMLEMNKLDESSLDMSIVISSSSGDSGEITDVSIIKSI
jgi:hypothetical protein